jgi:hypothetical protein
VVQTKNLQKQAISLIGSVYCSAINIDATRSSETWNPLDGTAMKLKTTPQLFSVEIS